MNICYLNNQYPKVSHTFIRREISALEDIGANVLRVSARLSADELVDPLDKNELQKTISIAQGKIPTVLWSVCKQFISSPILTTKVAFKCLQMSIKDECKVIKYFIYLSEACYLKILCKKHSIDHIHAHFGTNPATVAMFCRLIGGPKYSFTVHGPEEFDKAVSLSLGDKISHADFVVAISYFCQSQLFRWCKSFGDWEKVKIIRCGLGADSFDKPTSITSKTLIAVGRLSEQKGFPILLKSALQLKNCNTDFKLEIIGDGPMREDLESYIENNNLSDSVSILGYMSGQEVRDKLDQGCALIVPSFGEGLPVVIMESFARSRPVLTTQIAAMSELVDEGENGWIVAPSDTDALTKKIQMILALSSEKLDVMGEHGRQRTLEQHNSEIEAKKLYELFLNKQSEPSVK